MQMEQPSIISSMPLMLSILSLLSLHSLWSIHALNQEGLFLQQVKQSLFDPAGSLSSWFDRDATPCNWTGITCARRGNGRSPSPAVVSVNLAGAALAGPFPIFLCRLRYLSVVSMSNNSINSSLPLSISLCKSLTYLDLSENLLEGPIPDTLSQLPHLRCLNLDANYLSGDIPASFGEFRRLESLILTSNLLNGTIPASLGNITSLKRLQLAYNPFRPSQLAPELGNLTNLEDFWLTNCGLIGSIPESFAKLSRLANFDVAENGLTGPIPTLFFQLKNIVQLELYNNSFTGKLPSGWANLTELRRFDASMNRLTGRIPDELCQLPLESLHLYENKLMGALPESMAKSPNLYGLRLFSNRLNGSLPSELGKNSPLQTLDVSGNQFSGKIPESLCAKGKLEELLLIFNLFSGNIPASLAKCQSLGRVRLRFNQLTGEVPAEFWGLPHVYLLDLGNNVLSGHISHMIQGAKNLSTLVISNNKFSGNLPDEIGMLDNLIDLEARHNKFSGKIPSSLVKLEQLSRLDLYDNVLSGEIPEGIRALKQLSELNLARNKLSGEIPDEIGYLPGLNYLDLSWNNFSGEIPLALENLKLNELNLSCNHLSGTIPPLFDKDVYKDSFLENPGLCGGFAGLCPRKRRGRDTIYGLVLRSVSVIGACLLIVGLVFLIWKHKNIKKVKKGVIMNKWTSFQKLGFSETEIITCIDENNVIGSGASGKVYKAVLSDGEVVAVKKLWERSNKDDSSFSSVDSEKDEFEVEVQTLGNIRHKNIVRLLCCCSSGSCKLLVYEYMPNGSLGDLLHSSKGGLLDWPTRLRIALDAAEGLSYLHHDCVPPIVHRDVKSNNILLDEHLGSKISDFGVAKIVKVANKGVECMSAIAGSCGYIAPEYAYTLRVNEKSDIYSFGIVLLELLTGRRPVDPDLGDKDLATWVCTKLNQKGIDHVIDPNLASTYKEEICKVLNISLLCTSPLPVNRPSMRRVVKMLQESSTHCKTKTAEKECKLSTYSYQDNSKESSIV
nr:receptor-like protein kinase HSL1 [Coffea arabica]